MALARLLTRWLVKMRSWHAFDTLARNLANSIWGYQRSFLEQLSRLSDNDI